MPDGRSRPRIEHASSEGSVQPGRVFWSTVVTAFGVVAVVLAVVVAVASATVHRPIPFLTGPGWLDGWFQFDSGWYYAIATGGYDYTPGQQSSIAFFPTYPMAVRLLSGMVGDVQLAGTLVGVGSGLAAVLLFAGWVRTRLPRRSAMLAVAVLLLYPFSLYLYGAMYADSLFLLTALGAFLLLERRSYVLAGLVGALATAGRPVGVAVAAGLVVRMLELLAQDRGEDGLRAVLRAVPAVRWRQAGVLLSGAGLLAWTVYLGVTFGNPLAFVEVESAPGWDQGVGPRTWFKVAYVTLFLESHWRMALLLSLQAAACLAAVLLLRRVWRLFGAGYLVYALVVLAIPIVGTDDFMGTGRYVLVAFPVMAAAGDFLATRRHRWIAPLVLAACGLLLAVLTSYYARGIEVS
ncbi:hypothetical protein CSO01_33390 [Cellulomonas soli]|uniref:Glycosyltransferase RgtA/B/C/D-like domain-containing protein n=1 Tax=Cellulomonas soli TaxID=931535 RepID=A0A512PHF1_9CELL|nr:hypothetical protein CSO01_33390 [Cellulomonas soli]